MGWGHFDFPMERDAPLSHPILTVRIRSVSRHTDWDIGEEWLSSQGTMPS